MCWCFTKCCQAQNDVVLRRALAGCGELRLVRSPRAACTEQYGSWAPKVDQVCEIACVCVWVSVNGCFAQGSKSKGKGGSKDKGGKDKRKGGASFVSPEEREAKMAKVECYKCHKLGHYSTACPS